MKPRKPVLVGLVVRKFVKYDPKNPVLLECGCGVALMYRRVWHDQASTDVIPAQFADDEAAEEPKEEEDRCYGLEHSLKAILQGWTPEDRDEKGEDDCRIKSHRFRVETAVEDVEFDEDAGDAEKQEGPNSNAGSARLECEQENGGEEHPNGEDNQKEGSVEAVGSTDPVVEIPLWSTFDRSQDPVEVNDREAKRAKGGAHNGVVAQVRDGLQQTFRWTQELEFRLGTYGPDGRRGYRLIAGEERLDSAAQREEHTGEDCAGGLQHEQTRTWIHVSVGPGFEG